jgi:hypothetical protein
MNGKFTLSIFLMMFAVAVTVALVLERSRYADAGPAPISKI